MKLTLTTRLIVTAIVLVVAVSGLVAVLTTVAMKSYLTSRLDQDVRRSVRIFAAQADPSQPSGPGFGGRYQAPGTLNAVVADGLHAGQILGDTPGAGTSVPSSVLTALGKLPVDDEIHDVLVPGEGSFRVGVHPVRLSTAEGGVDEGVLVSGLPTSAVDASVRSLIRWEIALLLLGVLAAGSTGFVVVRRQLRPLRDVAATAHAVADIPLAQGEIGPLERVPEALTDERTEVGQVGAALNILLEHVESSLADRYRSEQRVRQFVADASHELRTPLTTIRGYTELARARPEAVETALAKVEEESGRMTTLVEDLLLLARLDSGRPLERNPVDLTRLTIEAVADAQVLAPTHAWIVSAPDEPVEVIGDEMRLHQVLTNLLTNARRYTPPGTAVTVSVREDGFTVHDNGPGFPEGMDPFERFARGDTSRHHDAETGAGLGLALVKAIVTAHGGTVTLTSQPGDTIVGITLPRTTIQP
ncbi:sensor histidine kinase [Nocardioides sp. Kera G14]|uniref:sensor histidine kinase n=1 Tax=Nocardioides sp. Kera G14 TaxID=2884264 RepID=UPI001D11F4A1|nr:HAMP domain-containing sensor histidine kinase [Nocardioides sp. Kera G14]UDY22555.1 HAMP domain-containing histidine kinase [Nocardioides sp. Kera G14]